MDKITEYINSQWEKTVRYTPESKDTLIGLPYPYIVPCAANRFQELYYWDTYFGCRGLALSGRKDLVLSNLKNFFYEIETFGFIPNGSRTFYLTRSQPPFLGALIKLATELFPEDYELKKQSYEMLKKEFAFWSERRLHKATGLFSYGGDPDEEAIMMFYDCALKRRNIKPVNEAELIQEIALETLAQAESGWDFTARFEDNCRQCAAIDLNCLLYLSLGQLANLAEYSGESRDFWLERAAELKDALYKYCYQEDGIFVDYFFNTGKSAKIISTASFYPLWVGLCTSEEAEKARDILCKKLEYPFGMSVTENFSAAHSLQWEYPNSWPCQEFITMESLARYGFSSDAKRIAEKYVNTVRRNFEKSGDLWEKYNVITGSTGNAAEYETPAMMGWTAATYLAAVRLLAESSESRNCF